MLNEIIKIVNNMNPTDENVITLKALLKSYLEQTKLYMLRYNGKYLTYHIENHNADFSNGTTVCLGTDETNPIWTTDNLIIAVYNKYVSTQWYNSDMNQTTHSITLNPKDIEVVDSFGRIYSRKPITNRTKAILHSKIKNDNGYLKYLDDEKWANSYCDYYDQIYLLEECKDIYKRKQGKIKVSNMSLDTLYEYRKDLVKIKGERLRNGKSVIRLQKKLDTVNNRIIKLGGK